MRVREPGDVPDVARIAGGRRSEGLYLARRRAEDLAGGVSRRGDRPGSEAGLMPSVLDEIAGLT